MQIVAITSLMVIFILNYIINPEYFEALGSFSPYVAGQRPEIAWIFALMLAIFLSIFPSMDKEFRVTITLGIIIIIILFFIGGPAIAFFSTYDMYSVGTALANSLIEFMKILTVLLYWAPILFGVYGIFSREKKYIFISILFFIGIIVANDIYLISQNLEHTKTEGKIPLFTAFALALICYFEMSDSSITFFKLNDSAVKWERDISHKEHLDRILQRYFGFFILFCALVLVLAFLFVLNNSILKAIGSDQVASSIEVHSVYGTIISLLLVMILLLFIGYMIRHETKLRKFFNDFFDSLPGSSEKEKKPAKRRVEVDEYKPPPPRVIYVDD